MTWSTKIKLETLTPLWTGGVDGKVDRIHETAIIGSLRWWFEALVRGVGGHACDPTKHECQFDKSQDQEKPEREKLREAGLCDVCQVFGATGWRRRFRLEVMETDVSDALIEDTISLTNTDENGNQRTSSWYFRDPTHSGRPPKPNTPKQGFFTIKIQPLAPDFNPQVIAGLIQFVVDWAALGARTQMGFGVVKCLDDPTDPVALREWLNERNVSRNYPSLPNIQHMFFAKISPKNEGGKFSDIDTFNIKYNLRRLFFADANVRHFVMGKVYKQSEQIPEILKECIQGEKKIAAKVKISLPYHECKEIRVWGWIPKQASVYQNSWNRDKVVNEIYKHLKANYNLKIWREINSPRDTLNPKKDNVFTFLQDLMVNKNEDNAT